MEPSNGPLSVQVRPKDRPERITHANICLIIPVQQSGSAFGSVIPVPSSSLQRQ